MTKRAWTTARLRVLAEFDELTTKASSPDQMDRIEARLALRRFERAHGRQECETMFARLQARDRRRRKMPR